MSWWQLLIYGGAGLAMSVFSGIAGGGAGFVMTPLAIVLGLTPAQAVSSGKFNGLAVTIGSLSGLGKANGRVSKVRIAFMMLLALVVGLLVPFVIKALESDIYRVILGGIIILMIPVMLYKKIGLKPRQPSRLQKALGGVLLTASLFLQGAFSGGLGSLVNVVLMGLLGQTAIEAQVTKRWSQLILNTTIILGVVSSHLIVWPVAVVGATVNLVGSFIGGRMAAKKGDAFAINVMLVLMLVSGVVLILGAI